MPSLLSAVASPMTFTHHAPLEGVSRESPSTSSSHHSLLDSSGSSLDSLPSQSRSSWAQTFDRLSQWSQQTLKLTRQAFQERTGQIVRTQDLQLEEKIQVFCHTKADYGHLLTIARQMRKHFVGLLDTQRSLSQLFTEFEKTSTNSNDLTERFQLNGRYQDILTSNGQHLLNSLNRFVEVLETLLNKTMEDASMSLKCFERSRIEYDTYRADYERVLMQNHTDGVSLSNREESIERQYQQSKQRYDKYRDDLLVKLTLLEENRLNLLKQQLTLFHQAIRNYFSSTDQQLRLT